MSLSYRAVDWNRQKKIYSLTATGLIVLFMALYGAVTLLVSPDFTLETVIIRGTSLAALLILHFILCIGPLARLDRRFLPLLYNRRHLGVMMFLLALIHGVFAVIQFHALGNDNPLVSVFSSYRMDYRLTADGSLRIAHFPFEPLGVGALLIFFVMAATSHDFWLRNLGAAFWKALHLGVYVAYALVLGHVALGVLQTERSAVFPILVLAGFTLVAGLHVAAGWKERRLDASRAAAERDGFEETCLASEIAEGRAAVVLAGGVRVAVWRHKDRFHATSNTCRHQGGPLGEGRIIDGCITCPWHGWNYQPEDGCSPPPFKEVVETHAVRLLEGRVWVQAKPNQLKVHNPGVADEVLK